MNRRSGTKRTRGAQDQDPQENEEEEDKENKQRRTRSVLIDDNFKLSTNQPQTRSATASAAAAASTSASANLMMIDGHEPAARAREQGKNAVNYKIRNMYKQVQNVTSIAPESIREAK